MTAAETARAAFAFDAPRHAAADQIGVLLCHGFTATPQSMRPWADYLAQAGYSVRLPLLPGHGTSWQQLNQTGFSDWLAGVDRALTELRPTCDAVFVAGLSMGGTLALRLAQLRPGDIAGLILVNPSILSLRKDMWLLPLLKHLVGSRKGIASDIADRSVAEDGYNRTPLKAADSLRRAWATVRAGLPAMKLPVLLLHSAIDHVVEPENSRVLLEQIGSQDVTEVILERSFHVATLDYDAPEIFERSVAFMQRVRAAELAKQQSSGQPPRGTLAGAESTARGGPDEEVTF